MPLLLARRPEDRRCGGGSKRRAGFISAGANHHNCSRAAVAVYCFDNSRIAVNLLHDVVSYAVPGTSYLVYHKRVPPITPFPAVHPLLHVCCLSSFGFSSYDIQRAWRLYGSARNGSVGMWPCTATSTPTATPGSWLWATLWGDKRLTMTLLPLPPEPAGEDNCRRLAILERHCGIALRSVSFGFVVTFGGSIRFGSVVWHPTDRLPFFPDIFPWSLSLSVSRVTLSISLFLPLPI